MQIEVKCYATLMSFQPENAAAFPVEKGETVEGLLGRLGIKAEDVKIVFINGTKVGPDAALGDGDRVGIFPAVGGG